MGNPKHRLTVIIGELLFNDSFYGALIGTAAAVDANVSVDDVLLVTLGNSLNRALIGAGAALDTSVSDNECHDITSIYVV